MKNKTSLRQLWAVSALSLTALVPGAFAQLTVPGDGSDGALNINTSTVIDLSQAVTGTWNANNSANAGKGIYDADKWAVVFKYSSVNIQNTTGTNGVITNSLTFANHPSHAPVVWIVSGDVTINGVVSVNGRNGTTLIPQVYLPSEPGPGGFRGGAYSPLGGGAGYGRGGVDPSSGNGFGGTAAGYAGVYGNPEILPLIGGSIQLCFRRRRRWCDPNCCQ